MILNRNTNTQAAIELRKKSEEVFSVIRQHDGGKLDGNPDPGYVQLVDCGDQISLPSLDGKNRHLTQGLAVCADDRAPQATALVAGPDGERSEYVLTTKSEKTGLFGLFGPTRQVMEYKEMSYQGTGIQANSIATFDMSGKVLRYEDKACS